jgi:hypothetical protein
MNQKGEDPTLRCRRCGCAHFLFLEVRRVNGRTVRRAECRHCGATVSTTLGISTNKQTFGSG